ncbi:MAG: hypothetical protein RI907_1409 [Pseudomonadota bacterium]
MRWSRQLSVVGCVVAMAAGAAHAEPEKFKLDDVARAALGSLGDVARHKVKRWQTEALFATPTNDVIVEYQDEVGNDKAPDRKETRERRGARKHGLRQRLGSDAEDIDDYESLPMSFKRMRSHRAMAALLNDPDVKAVYPNEAHKALGAQALPLIGQPYAAGAGFQGEGTTVAVLDSGLDYSRAAFGSCTAPGKPSTCRVVAAQDIAFPDFLRDRGSYHGTNVAGIIAAVAPKTKLIGLDVFTGDSAMSADLVKAVNWVITNKAKYNIVAMNLSLGASTTSATDCASSWATTPFANARAAGIIPVVASGNSAIKTGISVPACTPGAVSVGAVYDTAGGSLSTSTCSDTGVTADQVTCFSNSAANLDLLAPGAGITAAGITMTGTSQASPHVAGAIAVLKGSNAAPNDTVDQTLSRLKSTGKPVTDTKNGVVIPRIDLWQAMQTLGQPAP